MIQRAATFCLFLTLLLSPFSASWGAFVKGVVEGIPATGNTVKIDTATTRVEIATTSYNGAIATVGLYTTSNVVVSNTVADNCVIYATGSLNCLTITQAGVAVSTGNLWSTAGTAIKNTNSGTVLIGTASVLGNGMTLGASNVQNTLDMTGKTQNTIRLYRADSLKWQIGTNIDALDGLTFYDNVNGVSSLFLNLGGNIGLQQASPVVTLDVNGAVKSTATIVNGYDTTGVWVSTFTPFFTGFSANPAGLNFRWKRIGRLIYIIFFYSTTTSNSTALSMTFPFNSSSSALETMIGSGTDNGTSLTTPCLCAFNAANSNVVNCYKDTSPAGTAWTNINGKRCYGSFFYEANAD